MLDLRDVESVAAKGMSVRAATALALVAELRAAREARDELAFAVRDLLSWAKRRHGGDLSLHPEEYFRTTEHAQRVLADHAAEEPTP